MSNLCIIPARGGSKRIPRKNIREFLGKPIIAYSIEAALNSGLFDEVMVSTDDNEIAEIAIKYGAKVPFMRGVDSSNDFATLSDVIEEVKERYSTLGKRFDYICCILPTAPLIKSDFIQESFNMLVSGSFDSIRPIVRFSYPVQRGLKLKDHKIKYMYPEYAKSRSQDLEPIYYDAGMFYWMKYASGLIGDSRSGYIISESEAQDIDTLEDWNIAEIKYRIINNIL